MTEQLSTESEPAHYDPSGVDLESLSEEELRVEQEVAEKREALLARTPEMLVADAADEMVRAGMIEANALNVETVFRQQSLLYTRADLYLKLAAFRQSQNR